MGIVVAYRALRIAAAGNPPDCSAFGLVLPEILSCFELVSAIEDGNERPGFNPGLWWPRATHPPET